jgi:hypothetical protein
MPQSVNSRPAAVRELSRFVRESVPTTTKSRQGRAVNGVLKALVVRDCTRRAHYCLHRPKRRWFKSSPRNHFMQTGSWPSREAVELRPPADLRPSLGFPSRVGVGPSAPRRGAWRSLPSPGPAPASGARRGARAWPASRSGVPDVAPPASPRGWRAPDAALKGRARSPEAHSGPRSIRRPSARKRTRLRA